MARLQWGQGGQEDSLQQLERQKPQLLQGWTEITAATGSNSMISKHVDDWQACVIIRKV